MTGHTMTPAQLAEFLQTTTDRLYDMRSKGTGPRFIKVGREVRYLWPDIKVWLAANTYTSTSSRQAGDLASVG